MLEHEFRQVPGVADVVSWGGGTKQYETIVDSARLRAYNLTLKQVIDAASSANSNSGGGYIVSAIVAVIGFLPAALSHGIGAEIQKPLARVVIGGLISSTALTLLSLPAVYALFASRSREPERRDHPPATPPA